MKIAIEGCCHGELDKIYETIAFLETKEGIKIDLLICCGDFQAVRNEADMICMAVPQKYQSMKTFWKYYAGLETAPMLTLFIGGNHEASNYLQELPYGGWVAPNIYYLGYANVIRFGGVRIGGLSGIYKGFDYNKGHFEHPPYNKDTIRSAYHVRNVDVFRLKQISRPLDVMLTHDWPRGIYNYGDVDKLLRSKSFFKEEVESNTLGNPMTEPLLERLQPSYWFSAHLHCKFAAVVEHKNDTKPKRTTKFLALDKCLPKRDFLQIVDIPHDGDLKLELDPEWLVILKSTNHLMSLRRQTNYMPGPGCEERWDFTVTDQEMENVRELFDNDLTIPENFERTVPAYDPAKPVRKPCPPQTQVNPQTELLCTMLEITDPNTVFLGRNSSLLDDEISSNDSRLNDGSAVNSDVSTTNDSSLNPDEISLDDVVSDGDDDVGDDVDAENASDDVIIESERVSESEEFPTMANENLKFEDAEIMQTFGKDVELSECVSNVSDVSCGRGDGRLDGGEKGLVHEKFKLSLPEPKLTSTPSRLDSSPSMDISPRLDSSISSTADSSGMEDVPERPIKRFKRRNHLLYDESD